MSIEEATFWPRLESLKDRFLRYWPGLGLILVDLERDHLTPADRVLVIGSGRLPKRLPGRVIRTDVRPFPQVQVLADAQQLGFADGTFQAVVCHQVLEHLPQADRAVAELHRVLQPGGKLIVSVPFFHPFHASPDDFRRWTIPGLRVTCQAFHEVDSGIYQGPVAGFLVTCQHFVALFVPGFHLSYLVRGILGYLLWPLRYLDLIVARLPQARDLAVSFYYVGIKST